MQARYRCFHGKQTYNHVIVTSVGYYLRLTERLELGDLNDQVTRACVPWRVWVQQIDKLLLYRCKVTAWAMMLPRQEDAESPPLRPPPP